MSGSNSKINLRARFFARFYDRVLEPSELAGLADRRRELISGATGRTLEIGAGTGLNVDHYQAGVESLVLSEPDSLMASRLRRRVAEQPREAFIEIVECDAQELPFPDGSFDTVVCTLVLCTVPDPERTLSEVTRVLAPGGQLLFLEHVLGEGSTARWQRLLAKPWSAVACGCRCDRPTAQTISASELQITDLNQSRMPKAAKIIKPMIHGRAVLPGAEA